MTTRPAPLWLLILGGLGAGILSGLLGVGGGIVLVPFLVAAAGLAQKSAQATSLFAIVFTAVAGAIAYASHGTVLLVPSVLIVVGGLIGSWLGAELVHRLPERTVRLVFALVMVVAAARMVFPAPVADGDVATLGLASALGYVAAGVAMGLLSGLVGVGGGIILVPLLILVFHVVAQTAQGTSLLVMVPIALMGAWRNSRHGYTNWRIGAVLGVGGVLGSPIGVAIAQRVEPVWLQRLFAALLVWMAFRMARAVLAARPATS